MGFIDDFKEWSTLKKVAFILIVCCIGLIIVGVLGGGLFGNHNTSTTTNSNSSANDSSNQVYTDGTYNVGSDLPAGEYKFTQTSSDGGFVEKSSLLMTLSNSVEKYESTTKKGESVYITVDEGETLRVHGGELVPV